MQRILYLIQKEFRQILRERLYIGLIFVMPLFQIILMGFAVTTDVRNLTLAVVDNDHSVLSQKMSESLAHTESFDLRYVLESEKQAVRLMDRGEIKAAVIIPEFFERDLKVGNKPKIQALLDGVDGNSAGIALAYISQIALRLQRDWIKEVQMDPRKIAAIKLSDIQTRMLYNPSLDSKYNIVPGIIAVLLMMITSFLTGMTIVREKEIGTLEQLMVTPIKNLELMLGKVIPLAIVGFLLFNMGILGAGVIFGIWIQGNLLSLYLMAIIFMLSTLGLGILASTVARTQQQAMFFSWFFMLFALILSGFFIPLENMPDWVQKITYLNPVRYFMIIIREIYLKGTSIKFLWKEAGAMLIFGAAMISFASLRFHKRLS